jgi:MinD-like ATPase involved in chromosome partitioning or flagellar assembly
MNEDSKIISSGPFKGKRIEFAPTTGIDRFFGISKEFMKKIFDFEPGEYLITDESSLHDFTGLDEMELPDIQKRIQDLYDIDVSDMGSGNLLKIFEIIYRKRRSEPS